MSERYIGLMSGTSLDGVDAVLVDFTEGIQVLAHASEPFPDALRHELLALNSPGPNELHRAALAANALARLYADLALALKARSDPQPVRAIGAHGQTVRHQPGAVDGIGYTVQLNAPALLAEFTGLDVVADFRSRDVAAGGQGAPLVPAFHRAVFGRPGETVVVANIGGIGNLSILPADGEVLGFDTGPGNALMDAWCERHRGQRYDAEGAWAASGHAVPSLLTAALAHPYFARAVPKSTGRDDFHMAWLDGLLAPHAACDPADVQATLCELTACSIAQAVRTHATTAHRVLVAGGGALNDQLMRRLAALLTPLHVTSSAAHGLPPLQVEAAAFAWLARAHVRREPGNVTGATGARGPRVLGALYPA